MTGSDLRSRQKWAVRFGTQTVLILATNEREAVSLVRDRIDKARVRKGLSLTSRDDFTCSPASAHELALAASTYGRRTDQGVLDV